MKSATGKKIANYGQFELDHRFNVFKGGCGCGHQAWKPPTSIKFDEWVKKFSFTLLFSLRR